MSTSKPRVAVAAASRIAADAGASVAGNAVDAAVAAALVSACTDVGIMSPGGGCFITTWPADADPCVIDGYARAPGRGQPGHARQPAIRRVAFDYGGQMQTGVGYGSVATPGLFAGLHAALVRDGSRSWASVLKPAIEWAARGFPLTGAAAEYLSFTHEAVYTWDETSRRILHHDDGRVLEAGDVVHVPGLTETLETLARDGIGALYGGAIGRRVADGVTKGGGLLGIEDLAAYRAVEHVPLRVRFGNWQIAVPPPPSVGGPCLAAMMTLLDHHDGAAFDAGAAAALARAQQGVLSYRQRVLDVAGAGLEPAASRLLELCAEGDWRALTGSPSTIHVSAVDDTGLACSITGSAGYGSGAMVPGTGLWLNNSLGETDLLPGAAAAPAPGARLPSNMAPTVARSDEGAVLAIGSPGASRITTATAQALLHHIRYGLPLDEAIAAPRLHVEIGAAGGDRVAVEPGVPLPPLHGLTRRPFAAPDMYFGGVNAVLLSSREGLHASGDARRSGQVAYG